MHYVITPEWRAEVARRIAERGWTNGDLARAAGTTRSAVMHLLTVTRSSTLVAEVERALGMRDDNLASDLARRLRAFSDAGALDELKVIDGFVHRLEKGLAAYGPLDLASDRRDFQAEGDEEIADWAVYRACARYSQRRSG